LGEIKGWFDPKGLMNPGKIVNPPRQDDRSLFRYPPGYRTRAPSPALDWSAWGGFAGAVEMCNNNGHCRKFDPGTMCPSYGGRGRPGARFADACNNWCGHGNLDAAVRVLEATGHRVMLAGAREARPRCCGRTCLAAGMVDRARAEARRTVEALRPFGEKGIP